MYDKRATFAPIALTHSLTHSFTHSLCLSIDQTFPIFFFFLQIALNNAIRDSENLARELETISSAIKTTITVKESADEKAKVALEQAEKHREEKVDLRNRYDLLVAELDNLVAGIAEKEKKHSSAISEVTTGGGRNSNISIKPGLLASADVVAGAGAGAEGTGRPQVNSRLLLGVRRRPLHRCC